MQYNEQIVVSAVLCTVNIVYFPSHTCMQCTVYMYIVYSVHVYSAQCTCISFTVYMYTGYSVHVYSVECTCIQCRLYTVYSVQCTVESLS